MQLSDIQSDVKFWQRMLRLAGYYTGKTDGIVGPLTRAAESAWIAAARAAKEECGSFDDRSEKNLATLLPQAQRVARLWLKAATTRAAELGVSVKIIDGTCTYAEQNKLYAKTPRVTNARGDYSWHNFGLAFDFGLFAGAAYLGESKHYSTLGALARSISGAEWGGDWTGKLVDLPYIQLGKFASTAAARAAFEE